MRAHERNGSTRAWRELRARAIRREIRRHGAVYCRACGKGPLDADAVPGSSFAIDADHVAPVALGGRAVPAIDGVRLTCPPCNRGEGRRIALERQHRAEQADEGKSWTGFGTARQPLTRQW